MKKKIMVTKSSMPSFEEYVEMIKPLWDSCWLTNMGEYHQKLEQDLLDYMKVPNISLFSNGHMALELLIQAMNLTGEVITTPFTFASTTHAIVRNGLTPVFCDINPKDFTIDVEKIEALITEKTSAIIPVHVYGNICNDEMIMKIAKKHNLKVIYDAAHAFGEEYNGVSVGKLGDASMFSFHATKVYNTIEGGAVTYKNKDIGNKLYKLKNFGIKSEVIVDGIGANAKMNEFQAAMGICNLKHLNKEIIKRKAIVERYISNLKNINGIQLNYYNKKVKMNYAYFPIIINESEFGVDRDTLCEELKKENIFARKYFYPLTNTFECFKGKFNSDETPCALYISERVITLPLYADLSLEDVDRVCDIINRNKK